MTQEDRPHPVGVARRLVSVTETVRANRRWWDALAGDYHAEYGAFLGE